MGYTLRSERLDESGRCRRDSSVGTPISSWSFAARFSNDLSSTGQLRWAVSRVPASARPNRPLPLKPKV